MIILRWPFARWAPVVQESATLGNFDGVHLGHQLLLRQTASERGGGAALCSFYPHPAKYFGSAVKHLTSLRQRLRLLDLHGCSRIFLFRFSRDLARLNAAGFLEILRARLGIEHLVVGPDANVGCGREAGVRRMAEIFEGLGGRFKVVPFVEHQGRRVSSSQIRLLVQSGDLKSSAQMLGRAFAIEGRVLAGQRRGSRLGFPTINLRPRGIVLPPEGVYASRVRTIHGNFPGVTNIGRAPTFGGKESLVETHLLDYEPRELRRTRVEVELEQYLRPERVFSGAEALRRQIFNDIDDARRILEK